MPVFCLHLGNLRAPGSGLDPPEKNRCLFRLEYQEFGKCTAMYSESNQLCRNLVLAGESDSIFESRVRGKTGFIWLGSIGIFLFCYSPQVCVVWCLFAAESEFNFWSERQREGLSANA